jgi:predicted small metal-binding protein
MTKRVIECNVCGEPLAAANGDELLVQVRKHYAAEHENAPMDEDQAREMIAREAYDAGDA